MMLLQARMPLTAMLRASRDAQWHDSSIGVTVFRHASSRRTSIMARPRNNRAGQQHGIDRDAQRKHSNDSVLGRRPPCCPGFRSKLPNLLSTRGADRHYRCCKQQSHERLRWPGSVENKESQYSKDEIPSKRETSATRSRWWSPSVSSEGGITGTAAVHRATARALGSRSRHSRDFPATALLFVMQGEAVHRIA
jgi:hypothetical protein